MGRWWLVNFKVSAVRCHKRFHVLNSARRSVTMIATHVQPIPSQSYFKHNSGESLILFILRVAPQYYLLDITQVLSKRNVPID